MAELTLDQKWELLRRWAQDLVGHAEAKDDSELRHDLREVTNAVNMIETHLRGNGE